jgi:hypothetical protein
LSSVLPAALARLYGDVSDWDDLMTAVRRVRTADCRRALTAWPFQIAPSLAALVLREAQMQAWASLASVKKGA